MLWHNWTAPLALGCLSLLSGTAAAQVDEASFDTALSEVDHLMGRRKWKKARAALLDNLELHAQADYITRHWVEIAEGLTRCAFWESYTAPLPADVVHGELMAWNPDSGAIQLRYRREDLGFEQPTGARSGERHPDETPRSDFRETDTDSGLFIHPLKFKGTYHIKVRGKSLTLNETLPLVLVAWNWDSLQGLAYGRAYGVAFGNLTAVFEWERGAMTPLKTVTSGISAGRPFQFKVSVSASSISAFYNKKRLIKTKRPKGPYGQFGLAGFKGIDDVIIVGEVEPAWIEGLVDARIQRDWQRFEQRFDPLATLPTWMRSAVSGDAKQLSAFGDRGPRPTNTQSASLLARCKEHHEKGEFSEGLDYVNSTAETVQNRATLCWVRAHFLWYTGNAEAALEQVDRVEELDQEFFPARLMRGRLIGHLRSTDEGVRALEQVVIDFPEYVDAYEALAEYHLNRGDIQAAEDVLETALANGLGARDLERLGLNLLRVERGPTWERVHSYSTSNYIVSSDLSKAICHEVANELEDYFGKYRLHVKRPSKRNKEKFRVFIFSGSAGYQAYCEDLLGFGGEGTLGLYSPGLKQLLIWNSPRKENMMRTVRHEGFHQYFDVITSEVPVWLNEGMAEYFEQSHKINGRWKDNQVNELHLAILKGTSSDWTRPRELVFYDSTAFRARSGLHYPESWALVHFLFNSKRSYRKIIDELIDALHGGASRQAALERAFDGVDWEKLERDFAAHVFGLE